MHEFSLVDHHDEQIGDYVICDIRNKNAEVDTEEEELPMKKMRIRKTTIPLNQPAVPVLSKSFSQPY
ncbi:hypothetical protein Goshw_027965 [Gossypium schwendimanii]|uniref:Uncharacterized protein n=1 Tax=Gossypium schwendimanii TaxID=34291 RepID=A0A7J9MKV4_GOSSC|nr:hypothetical protein [Gossypium schwendimanii]